MEKQVIKYRAVLIDGMETTTVDLNAHSFDEAWALGLQYAMNAGMKLFAVDEIVYFTRQEREELWGESEEQTEGAAERDQRPEDEGEVHD